MKSGKKLLWLSILTRMAVIFLLVFLALSSHYLNYKRGYNNARLVELDAGKTVRVLYDAFDDFYSMFGDPVEVMQINGGMTWSIRLMGVPFTDPMAAISVLVKNQSWELGFGLGVIVPLLLAMIFGRVFCSYVCPASLIFFAIARFRKILSRFFYFPDVKAGRGMAWGVMFGTLILVVVYGHGVWSFVLPYFAVGQTIFHSLIFMFTSLSVAVFALMFFALLDLCLGNQFTCRYLCPTGRLLGFLGRRSVVTVKRDEGKCIETCQACNDICPMDVEPKLDHTTDCSLCGECLVVCPSQCLEIGTRK